MTCRSIQTLQQPVFKLAHYLHTKEYPGVQKSVFSSICFQRVYNDVKQYRRYSKIGHKFEKHTSTLKQFPATKPYLMPVLTSWDFPLRGIRAALFYLWSPAGFLNKEKQFIRRIHRSKSWARRLQIVWGFVWSLAKLLSNDGRLLTARRLSEVCWI